MVDLDPRTSLTYINRVQIQQVLVICRAMVLRQCPAATQVNS